MLTGPQAAQLRWIAAELRRVDEARSMLISRRAQLLDEIIRLSRCRPEYGSRGVPASASPASERQSRSPELSRRTAARWLLGAGSALVVIAAAIFTVAGWREIGPLGRAAILLGATALVLTAPLVLIRRGLNATAEAVAAVGLAMTIGDVALGQELAGGRPGPLGVAAYCALVACAWVGYGRAVTLTGPRVAAIGLAQIPAPLAMVGLASLAGWSGARLAGPVAVGLLLTAGGDVLLANLATRTELLIRRDDARGQLAASRTAAGAAIAVWLGGVLAAATALAVAPGPPALPSTAWLSAAFAIAAVVSLAGPPRSADLLRLARPAAAASGALAAVSLAILVSEVVPEGGGLAAFADSGFSLGCVATIAHRRFNAPGGRCGLVAGGSAAILGGAGTVAAPAALAALFGRQNALHPWSGGRPGPGPLAALPGWPSGPAVTGTLALLGLACLVARGSPGVSQSLRGCAGSVGLAAAALAAGSVPAAAHLTGWPALTVVTGAAAVLLLASVVIADRSLAVVAGVCAIALALGAVLWSLAAPGTTIAELATLAIVGSPAAALARRAPAAAFSTSWTLVAATGLAWAVPMARGLPLRDAALAALAVAVAASGLATALRWVRPVHSVVLDMWAGAIVVGSVIAVAKQRDSVAIVAVTAAVVASATAWLRSGRSRVVAVLAAGVFGLAAFAAQWRPLAHALIAPAAVLTHPWQRRDLRHGLHGLAGHQPGLALAIVVCAVGLAALVSAAGAWRGSGRTSADAFAFALPVLASPVGAAEMTSETSYWVVIGALLAITIAVTACAALGRRLAPAGAALVGAAVTFGWALAAPAPTLAVLGCLTAAYSCCSWRARLPTIRLAAASLCVMAAALLAWCAVLAAGLPVWQAGVATLGVAAVAQVVASGIGRASRHAGPAEPAVHDHVPSRRAALGVSVEITGWLVTAAGVGTCLGHAWTAALGLAIAGATCLGVSSRAARRPAVWAGLTMWYLAWCLGLDAAGFSVAEAYTAPGAIVALFAGWRASRCQPRPHSWVAYGPGLCLLFVPSLVLAWQDTGWTRPLLVGLAAAATAVAGARARRQAPLITGALVTVLDAGRQVAPAFVGLDHGWVLVAVLGAALLWAGATYEARLRDLNTIRRSLTAMR